MPSQAQWLKSLIEVFGGLGQKKICEFKASVYYITRSCLEKNKKGERFMPCVTDMLLRKSLDTTNLKSNVFKHPKKKMFI